MSFEMRHICAYFRISSVFSVGAGPGDRLSRMGRLVLSSASVSYTHLDVYKRQVLGLGSALQNEVPLRSGQRFILAGIPVEHGKEHKIEQTDQSGGCETPSPSEAQQQQAKSRDTKGSDDDF